MIEAHHNEEQIARGFARAPQVLKQLQEAGLQFPHFELYADASGRLFLGWEGEVTQAQYQLGVELVKSTRPYEMLCHTCMYDPDPPSHKHPVGITFCCGLVGDSE